MNLYYRIIRFLRVVTKRRIGRDIEKQCDISICYSDRDFDLLKEYDSPEYGVIIREFIFQLEFLVEVKRRIGGYFLYLDDPVFSKILFKIMSNEEYDAMIESIVDFIVLKKMLE